MTLNDISKSVRATVENLTLRHHETSCEQTMNCILRQQESKQEQTCSDEVQYEQTVKDEMRDGFMEVWASVGDEQVAGRWSANISAVQQFLLQAWHLFSFQRPWRPTEWFANFRHYTHDSWPNTSHILTTYQPLLDLLPLYLPHLTI